MRRREVLRGLGAATLSGRALPAMGSAYLAATPGEGSAQLLLDKLAGPQRAHWEALAERDPGALDTELRSQHRDDFARGDVISLGGWVLSQTEARLCALVNFS